MYTTRLLMQPILRGSLASIKSSHPNLQSVMREDYGSLLRWLNVVKVKVHRTVPSPYWNMIFRTYQNHFGNFCSSGSKFARCTMFGLSVAVASISILPRISYCTDDSDEEHCALVTFIRRLLVPVFFLFTVLMNWGHPGIIAARVTLILYTTKPSPFSVYLFVEQLRHQAMCQHPFIYKIMSCYAKKVEVEDYMFLCIARVELNDQNLTLLGILGNWWVLPLSSWQEAFSMWRNSFLIR